MAITKQPQKTDRAEKFIAGAPDSDVKPKGIQKGNKQQISVTIAPDLLIKLDEVSKKRGVSRAGFINLAVYHYLDVVFNEINK